jgi:putative tryptophan/tyrosine transport system substrate-binding protein
VATGVVPSLGRPGGNVTGVSIITTELGVKWIELLRELAPSANRIAYLTDTGSEGGVLVFKRMQEEAHKLKVSVQMFGGQQPKELERSLEAIARERFAGLIVSPTARLNDHRAQIVQFAARQKLPNIHGAREYAEAGGLVSYSPDLNGVYQRAADYVHRIAQGAKPAELPVERPTAIRMVLNLKTARSLGIPIPPSIRHRADELID